MNLKLEIGCGDDIDAAARVAVRIARVLDVAVVFMHNGVSVRVEPEDTAEDVYSRWQADYNIMVDAASGDDA